MCSLICSSMRTAIWSAISLPRPSFGSFFKETHMTSLSDAVPSLVGLSVRNAAVFQWHYDEPQSHEATAQNWMLLGKLLSHKSPCGKPPVTSRLKWLKVCLVIYGTSGCRRTASSFRSTLLRARWGTRNSAAAALTAGASIRQEKCKKWHSVSFLFTCLVHLY